jgi:NAD(P)-dependent dehydrogenase (short-subunit alcohol dehydrogenase family)
LTKTIARGFAKDNILAFSVAPGFTETEMAYAGTTEADVKRILSEIPLGSMTSPEEVAALVAFLCSERVRHMTGATFDINGASYVR